MWDGFFYIYAACQTKMHVKQITKIKKQSKKQCNESDISRFSSNDCLAPKLKTTAQLVSVRLNAQQFIQKLLKDKEIRKSALVPPKVGTVKHRH